MRLRSQITAVSKDKTGEMRKRIFTPSNLVYLSLVMGSGGFLWIVFNCTNGPRNPEEYKYVSLKKRELLLRHKEQQVNRKLKLLGISDIDKISQEDFPTIYAITPTYTRLTQKADLTRLSQTFLHIPKLHWIVVEDSNEKTDLVRRFLSNCGLTYTHLATRTHEQLQRKGSEPRWLKARGVEQRNLGLKWIREHFDVTRMRGVMYFADDDNTYDLRIFQQMRYTKKVSVWPVGLSGGLKWEGPICRNGSIIKFYTAWKPDRPLPVDMAGFAINVELLMQNRHVEMDPLAARGLLESSIVSQLVTRRDMEALADNCTKILVWHTQTSKPNMKQEEKLNQKDLQSDSTLEV